MIEIKNRWTGAVIYRSETAETIREAVVEAVARGSNLRGSNLRGSNLSGSNLSGSDLSGSDLSDSNLSDSNLRGSDLSGSDLSDSNLSDSNLRGSNLSGSDLSGSDLSDSNLSDSNLRDSNLSDSNLRGSDLSGSNLRGSNLSGSDLSGSNLSGSNLSGSNLRGSNLSGSAAPLSSEEALRERDAARLNHPRVPIVENLDAVVLAEIEAGAQLDMSQWHTCETTHCRSGWAIHKAGAAGTALESRLGPFVAGRLIYLVSTGRRPDFFASNDAAMGDIRRCAEEQKS